MIWTKLKRVTRSGFTSFWRNGFVSLASVLIMMVTLIVIGSVIFLRAGLTSSLEELKRRVDIDVYFVTSAQEADIQAIQTSLSNLPEVAEVQYTTRDKALANFKEKHKDDALTLQALDELGTNPLEASLNIRARETSQYDSIANFLQSKNALSKDGSTIIDKINYFQNKPAIDKLTRIIDAANKLGLFISILFIAISILITFNTIRLAIYTSRSEISVMKLVGASNKYIRGPFVITGMMYGLISAIFTLILFYPAAYYLGPRTADFFADIDVYSFYLSSLPKLFGILAGSGIAIGAISSWLAVKKYLNV